MIVLGIESTAHTLGIGVARLKSGKLSVISNEISRFPSTGKGFVPRELADHHAQDYRQVLEKAVENAGVGFDDVDAIAYARGPGMGACLRVGYAAAKSLSLLLDKPLVPVNHAVAHIEVGKWSCNARDPLVVYVSGGNTQIIAGEGRRYHVFGETLDVGLGNFLDVLGRELGTKPPDAIGLLAMASKGSGFVELPYTVKGMDLAFSGLQTAVIRKKTTAPLPDLAFSAVETSFSMLVEASERALCHTRKKELLLVGGVAQSRRLQEMFAAVCRDQGARLCVVPSAYAGDNGSMIALAGCLAFSSKGWRAPGRVGEELPFQDWRVDSDAIPWLRLAAVP